MSYDLGVFHTVRPHSNEDVGERYVALCSEANPRDYYGWGWFWKWLRSKFGGSKA
jgi:hypothetical protein